MGHYSEQEEAAIIAATLVYEQRDCTHNFQLSQTHRCKKCGVIWPTIFNTYKTTQNKTDDIHNKRKIQPAPYVGKIPVEKIRAAVNSVSVTLTEEQLKTKTTFASGAQKDILGKPRFDLIPPEAMLSLASTFTLGAKKYNDRDWEKGIPFSVALGALKRHLNAFELGDMINTADGDIEHIAHVMWWAVALTTFIKRGRIDLNDLPHHNELKGE